jgi:hypothetical protein
MAACRAGYADLKVILFGDLSYPKLLSNLMTQSLSQ